MFRYLLLLSPLFLSSAVMADVVPDGSAGRAVEITTTVALGALDDIETGNQGIDPVTDPAGLGAFFEGTLISGIPKHDPAGGQLIEVVITTTFNFIADAEIEVDTVTDSGIAHSASANILIDGGIYLFSDPVVSPVATEFLDIAVGCDGDPDAPPCFAVADDEITTMLTRSVDSGGLGDFIGSGNVTALQVGIFFPVDAIAESQNADAVLLGGSAALRDITYRVDYVVVAVPEPSSVLWLSALVWGGVLRRRR